MGLVARVKWNNRTGQPCLLIVVLKGTDTDGRAAIELVRLETTPDSGGSVDKPLDILRELESAEVVSGYWILEALTVAWVDAFRDEEPALPAPPKAGGVA